MKTDNFVFNGHNCTVISPEKSADGNPWVWRAEFLTAFNYADKALLEKGWHIAFCELHDQYGCDYAINEMKKFHDYIVEKYGLSYKADIFGFSRGGLYAFNYCLKYKEDIRTSYLDAPVLDIKSWPAGYGKAMCYKKEWEECKLCYSLTEETAKEFCSSPIDKIDDYLKTSIPTILVYGDADEVVPYEENSAFLEKALKGSSVSHKVIRKKGVGHHPHSLENPLEIVNFIIDKV